MNKCEQQLPATPSVLLFDHDPTSQAQFSAWFAELGWQLHSVATRDQCLSAVDKRDFDIIITELTLGEMMIQSLRRVKPGQAVIALTSRGSIEEIVETLRSGATDVLQRPLTLSQVQAAVDRVLEVSRSVDRGYRRFSRFITAESVEYQVAAGELVGMAVPLLPIEQLRESGRIDRHTKLRVQLAFQEALANSVEHGALELQSPWKEELDAEGVDRYSRELRRRAEDPAYASRTIRITVRSTQDRLTISIAHEGVGFNSQIPLPRHGDLQSLAPYGRGIRIIYGTMDSVQFSDGGRCIEMTKYLQSSGAGNGA